MRWNSADRLEQEIERRRLQLDAPEAQPVEQVLEVVRQVRHARDAEEAGEPLERVHGAEGVVDDLGIEGALRALLVEHEQIAIERLDDLLRFGEELLQRLVGRCASLTSEGCRTELEQLLGREGLGQVVVGAELHAAVAVGLAAVGGDDDERRALVRSPTRG